MLICCFSFFLIPLVFKHVIFRHNQSYVIHKCTYIFFGEVIMTGGVNVDVTENCNNRSIWLLHQTRNPKAKKGIKLVM
jgi:hypothetical protein